MCGPTLGCHGVGDDFDDFDDFVGKWGGKLFFFAFTQKIVCEKKHRKSKK